MTVVTSTTPYISKDTCSNPLSSFCTSILILTLINERNTDCIIRYLEINLHTCNKNVDCLNLMSSFSPARGTLMYKLKCAREDESWEKGVVHV